MTGPAKVGRYHGAPGMPAVMGPQRTCPACRACEWWARDDGTVRCGLGHVVPEPCELCNGRGLDDQGADCAACRGDG